MSETHQNYSNKYRRIRITVGFRYNEATGTYERKRKSFYGKSLKEARAKADAYLKRQSENDLLPSNTKFNLCADYYMYEILSRGGDFAEGSKVRYLSIYKHHISTAPFFRLRLRDIQSSMIQHWYIELKAKGVSIGTIKGINKVLGHVFNYLMLQDVINKNPLSSVSIPKDNTIKDNEIQVFTKEEVERILRQARNHKNYLLFLLALGCGLRLSELTALQYKDIKDGSVKIYKQVGQKVLSSDYETTHTITELMPPKSKTSIRTVPVPDNIIKIFEEKKKGHNPDEFIFATSNGNLPDPKNIRTQHRRLLKAAEVGYKKFHCYRATYCTNLIASGAKMEIVYSMMGHSSIETTMKYYTFVSNKEKVEAASRINNIFEVPK